MGTIINSIERYFITFAIFFWLIHCRIDGAHILEYMVHEADFGFQEAALNVDVTQ